MKMVPGDGKADKAELIKMLFKLLIDQNNDSSSSQSIQDPPSTE